jgi:hypothetical protein
VGSKGRSGDGGLPAVEVDPMNETDADRFVYENAVKQQGHACGESTWMGMRSQLFGYLHRYSLATFIQIQ